MNERTSNYMGDQEEGSDGVDSDSSQESAPGTSFSLQTQNPDSETSSDHTTLARTNGPDDDQADESD